AWEKWKYENGYFDFQDLITTCYTDIDVAPGDPQFIIIDEAQDMDRQAVELLRKWGKHTRAVIFSGDPWQCQPTGSMVLTSNNTYLPIEQLDPSSHRLVTYSRREGIVVGYRNGGHSFRVASRRYHGALYTVTAGGMSTRCTPEHLWLARFSPDVRGENLYVVYLMQKGPYFRVGWCKLFNTGRKGSKEYALHFNVRCNIEGAERAWILRLCQDKREVYIWGSIAAAKYGIPLTTFREYKMGSYWLTQEAINQIFSGSGDLTRKAMQCLNDHGLSYSMPIWERYRKGYGLNRAGGTSVMLIPAMHMMSGLMEVPVHIDNQHVKWATLHLEQSHYDGDVYSLEVDKNHTYIVDGMVTHNCLYTWRGSDPDLLIGIDEDHQRILKQSYRIPASVHRYAMGWMKRYLSTYTDLDFRPREVEGEVIRLRNGEHGESLYTYGNPYGIIDRIAPYLRAGKRVMLLTTCGYQLDHLVSFMRRHCIPYHNPYRRRRGDWNPLHPGNGQSLAEKILAFLKADPDLYGPSDGYVRRHGFLPWTVDDLQAFVSILDAKVMKYGAKKKIGALAYNPENQCPPYTLDDFEQWFTDEAFRAILHVDLEWFAQHVVQSKQKSLKYPLGIIKKYGRMALKEAVKRGKDEGPPIIVGTIHSVKGGEADVVVLFPDMSPSGAKEWHGTKTQRDVIARLFYVGMTRARETLILCEPGSGNAVPWP
ncbi:MAG TPA: ATP-binding domain-containing protein, partial [Alphaproteobacteria bacterium]|nr:ATP-binding domain-containing protein [Alphaproteobacteria bacterium]